MASNITVACSTFGNRLSGAEEVYLRVRQLAADVDVMIIHQVPASLLLDTEVESIQRRLRSDPNVIYIESQTQGLTLSRNIALQTCKSQYLLITDDDIWFVDDALSGLSEHLNCCQDVTCHTFESLKEPGVLRAIYPADKHALNNREILRVASFEMIVDCVLLRKLGVLMREDMGVGAGSDITMGEETVFLADIQRAGGKVKHHKKILVIHSDVSTGEVVSLQNIYSKGVIIRRSFSGIMRLKFFIRDAHKIIKNKERNIGGWSARMRWLVALFKGCYLSRL